MAIMAFSVSFAETAFTVCVNFEPSAFATDVLTSGATFWKPVTCFGSASTVYFDGFASGGSVEKTSAARNLFESSPGYRSCVGTNDTFFRPYAFLYPTRHVERVPHCGYPRTLQAPT